MDLGNFSLKNLGKDLLENKTFNNFVSNFIEELSEYLQNNKKTDNSDNKIDKFNNEMQHYYNERERIKTTTPLEENKTYVISGIYDNRLQVVDIDNGNEIEIFASTGDKGLDKFNGSEIQNRTYEIDRKEFLNLRLTDNVVLNGAKLNTNTDKVEIKSDLAWRLLADLYDGIKISNGQKYEIVDIKENELYLTNADGSGGYFPIYKELYPDFQIGDIVQRNDRIYNKVD